MTNIVIEKIIDDVIEINKLSRKKHEGRDDTPFEAGGLLASGEHDSDPSVSERRKRCQEGDEEARCNCRRGTTNSPECAKPPAHFKGDELPLDKELESANEMTDRFLQIAGNDPQKVVALMETTVGKQLYSQIEEQRSRDRKSDPSGLKNIWRLV